MHQRPEPLSVTDMSRYSTRGITALPWHLRLHDAPAGAATRKKEKKKEKKNELRIAVSEGGTGVLRRFEAERHEAGVAARNAADADRKL
eukprot:103384-Rhodomonas_salina.1